MATPHVAGLAALIISRSKSKAMATATVTAAIIASAVPRACHKVTKTLHKGVYISTSDPAQCKQYSSTKNNFVGYGVINTMRAVQLTPGS